MHALVPNKLPPPSEFPDEIASRRVSSEREILFDLYGKYSM